MALDPATWLEQAQQLAEGQRRRVNHDCGPGRTMIVDHKETGWSAYCWRCSDSGFVPHPQPSLGERIERLKKQRAVDDTAQADPRPPMPANFNPAEWPLVARVWLYKAGLGNDTITRLGFYWHQPTQRVVMPVFAGGSMVYWQARGFDPKLPKYINPPIDKPVFKQGSGDVLVLCEDMLSTVRVGEVTSAWCAMGTSLTDAVLADILAVGKPVRVWLDPDGAGVRGRRKYVPMLRAFGIEASAIRSDKDPKYYSKEEIGKFLLI